MKGPCLVLPGARPAPATPQARNTPAAIIHRAAAALGGVEAKRIRAEPMDGVRTGAGANAAVFWFDRPSNLPAGVERVAR
jgi:hypothetical protein